MTERAGRTAGFTLIEVLVALAILAVASGFAFSTVSDSFARLSQADLEQQAVTVAETAMARLGHDLPIQPGGTTGAEGDMHWQVEVGTALTDPPPAAGLAAYPISVSVEWQDDRVSRRFRLQSVRLGPEARPS